ncbi:MAG: ABC transporter permease [Gemmatimonadaceae bacterium]
MKMLSLVVANLKRHKLRTLLTVLGVALAMFLFASLRTVVTTLDAAGRVGSASRMVVQHATAIIFPVPMSYRERLAAMPGVAAVSWANWFGGQYGDGRQFFATFAIDAESYLAMYPELVIPADQREAFMRERTGALVGQRLLDKFGWSVGQNVTLRGTIYPGDWTFTIRGIYKPTDPAYGEETLLFHYAYLDERTNREATPGWYMLRVNDPSSAAELAKRVDDTFRNSAAPTKTGTEQAFNASFVTMYGNVGFLMNAIGMAVVFAILMVTANAMMMTARERTGEVAVLKTIGFSDRTLFLLVMAEAGLIALGGAALGLGGAKLLYGATDFTGGGFLPGFSVTTATLVIGLVIAAALAVASGLVPALRAARLPIVQALRHVE